MLSKQEQLKGMCLLVIITPIKQFKDYGKNMPFSQIKKQMLMGLSNDCSATYCFPRNYCPYTLKYIILMNPMHENHITTQPYSTVPNYFYNVTFCHKTGCIKLTAFQH